MEVKQYHVYWVKLAPTVGHEIKKTRPCVVISPDEINRHLSTIIIAPLTTKSRKYPTRVPTLIQGKEGWIVLEQLRTIDKVRLYNHLGALDEKTIRQTKQIIQTMLVD